MVCLSRIVFLVGMLGFIPTLASTGQSLSTQRYVPVELTLTSDRTYAHPHQDVQVEVVFEGPRQQKITVAGFWDGGTTYRVRFAPPEEGFWRYRTRASDTQNAGLQGQHGEVEVTFYTGDNPFALGNNYPNPFNPTTRVPFSLAEAAHVSIRVYDVLGREVSVLVDGPLSAGVHQGVFEANTLPTGVYLIRFEAAGTVQIQRVTLMK